MNRVAAEAFVCYYLFSYGVLCVIWANVKNNKANTVAVTTSNLSKARETCDSLAVPVLRLSLSISILRCNSLLKSVPWPKIAKKH